MARRLARLRYEREARRLAWLASWPDYVHAEGTRCLGDRAAAQAVEREVRGQPVPPFDEGARARLAATREALAEVAARGERGWRARRVRASVWLDVRRAAAALLLARVALRLLGPPRGGPRLTVRGWNGAYDSRGLLAAPSSSDEEEEEEDRTVRGPPSRAGRASGMERVSPRRRRRSSTRSRRRSEEGEGDSNAGGGDGGSGTEAKPRVFQPQSRATGPEFVAETRAAESAQPRDPALDEAMGQEDFDRERYYNDGPVYVGPCSELRAGRARRFASGAEEGQYPGSARGGERDARPWWGHYGVWRSVDGWVIAGPNVTLGLDPSWLYGHYDLRYPAGDSYSGLLCAGKPQGRGRLVRVDGSGESWRAVRQLSSPPPLLADSLAFLAH